MAEYLGPGVYIEDIDSGVNAMEGVHTSIAGFVGMASRGQLIGKPKLIKGMGEFHKYFGGYLGEEYGECRFLRYAVEQFFTNGGSECYVMRVGSSKQTRASVVIEDILNVSAMNSGTWGNMINVQIRKVCQAKTFVTRQSTEVELRNNQYMVNSLDGFYLGDVIEFNEKLYTITNIYDHIMELNKPLEGEYFKNIIPPHDSLQSVVVDIQITYEEFNELYQKCSLNTASPSFVIDMLEKSDLINMNFIENIEKKVNPENFYEKYTSDFRSYNLVGGTTIMPGNGFEDMYIGQDDGLAQRSGIQSFIEINDVSIMLVPGIAKLTVQNALIAHCEKMANRFAILDVPLTMTTVNQLCEYREQFDTNYGAIYHPWLQITDPLLKKNIYTPPSGTVAGVYARVDGSRGIWKAPANEVVKNVVGLSIQYNESEQARLNPKGVNLIRSLPGMGIRVWGARTCSSDGNWKYVNVRRMFTYLEESIKVNLNWVIYEPNNENLWSRVSKSINDFLTKIWRNGGLVGSTPNEAFFVNVGRLTMTEDDILNGRLICEIGVALVRPTEFITFRITEKTQDAS